MHPLFLSGRIGERENVRHAHAGCALTQSVACDRLEPIYNGNRWMSGAREHPVISAGSPKGHLEALVCRVSNLSGTEIALGQHSGETRLIASRAPMGQAVTDLPGPDREARRGKLAGNRTETAIRARVPAHSVSFSFGTSLHEELSMSRGSPLRDEND